MECSSDITKGPFKGLSEYKDEFGTYFKVFGVIILDGRFFRLDHFPFSRFHDVVALFKWSYPRTVNVTYIFCQLLK